jgi:hypothetical protein
MLIKEWVSNCCDAPSDRDMGRCAACKEGCDFLPIIEGGGERGELVMNKWEYMDDWIREWTLELIKEERI